jgi:hypothetical protein
MRFLSKLFAKGEAPLPVVEDPQLGRLEWSKADEAWIGSCNGFRFALSYERKAAPTPQLSAYAQAVLGDPGWLTGTFEKEKRNWVAKAPPGLKDEVAGLKFGLVHFSMHQDRGYIIANIEGGGGDRSWRIEYHGRECDGLGFDT